MDIGPWNNDDDYWNPSDTRTYKGIARGVPEAKAALDSGYNGGKSGTGLTVTAPGGIDIGDGTYADLGLGNSDYVDVTFLWLVDDGSASAAAPPAAAPKTVSAPKGGIDLSNVPILGVSSSPPLDRATDLGRGYTFVAQTGHNMPDVIAKYWNAKGGVPPSAIRSPRYLSAREMTDSISTSISSACSSSICRTAIALLLRRSVHGSRRSTAHTTRLRPSTTRAKSRYVAATGHGISGGIFQWYAANGDSDMFGAPIAEEGPYTTTDGRKVTAQLFERARIEMDANGDITLGRLGAEWLSQRGWL